ncbi:MAG: enoyl-CoA hydratase/isomerase family protein [Acidimicrobiales bacterium]
MRIERWTGDRARAALASPDLDRTLGVVHGVAALVVDLADDDPGADIAAATAELPIVSIGCGPVADAAWDIGTTDAAAAIHGIDAAPRAAVITAQTLRLAGSLTPEQGLVVESLAYATLQGGPEFAAWLAGRGRRVRNDESPRVLVDADDDPHATVTLNRPRLRNLLDARMRDELVDAFRVLALGPARPIVLRGAGPAFCAGGDPAEFGTTEDTSSAHLIRSSANVAPWLMAVADRTTAMVHGPCVGAGVELAAFCRRVVAHPGTRFRLPETRMGLMPGAGGTVSIPARIGRQRTLEWLLADEEIDATTALAWGLVDELA